jgi:hypothetical protein
MTAQTAPATDISENVNELWRLDFLPAGCPSCGQAFLIEKSRLGTLCPNCAIGKLVSQPARIRPEPPELLIPFQINRNNLDATINNFVQGVWLHSDDFNPSTLLGRLQPVFWPMWLVDSDVKGIWQGEGGFDYQVESSHDNFTAGQWQSRQVTETRIRWEPRTGQLSRHYDNVAVPALTSHGKNMAVSGNYQLTKSIPYNPAQIGAAEIQIPDLHPEEALVQAKNNFNHAAMDECQRAVQGQHFRNFSVKAVYDSLNWTQLLLPMYITYYFDDSGVPQIVYINGQSGSINGPRLASQSKGWRLAGILAGIAAVLFILALLSYALAAVLPPVAVLATLLVVAAFGLGLFALIPAIWPWQWNKKQKIEKITSR